MGFWPARSRIFGVNGFGRPTEVAHVLGDAGNQPAEPKLVLDRLVETRRVRVILLHGAKERGLDDEMIVRPCRDLGVEIVDVLRWLPRVKEGITNAVLTEGTYPAGWAI